ncbi:MAG TPA: TetR family transcriptional regulator [Solirubrobacteraceae bacterium]|nr:TetR family transcriptional regulator [Solirubrobacteraceae bacterium]
MTVRDEQQRRSAKAGATRGRAAPEDVRGAIVAATVRLIGRGGVDAVTHRAVAAEAGVSLSSTTYHFGSRDEIVDAALRRVAERELERLASAADALGGQPDLPSLAHAIGRWLAEQLAEDEDVVRAGYHLQLEAARRPALQDIHLAWGHAVIELAERVLGEAGSPQPDADARILAAAIDGLRLEQLTAPGRSPSPAPLIERLLTVLTRGPQRRWPSRSRTW